MYDLTPYRPALASRYLGFDNLFNDIDNFLGNTKQWVKTFPFYTISETGAGTTIEVALAGYDKEDIKVRFNKSSRTLTITAEKQEKQDKKAIFSSLATRSFARAFKLSDKLNVASVTFKNGMLTIVIVKEPEKEEEILELEIN